MVFNNISLLSYKMRELNSVSCRFPSGANILCLLLFFPRFYKLYSNQVPSPRLQAAQPPTCRLKTAPGWETHGSPLRSSCLENPTDRGAWRAAVLGVTESRPGLSDFSFTFRDSCQNVHAEPFSQNWIAPDFLPVPRSSVSLMASPPSPSSQGMERCPRPVSTAPSAGQYYLQWSPRHRPPAGLDARCLPAASLRALSHQPGHLSPDHCQASQLPATRPQARLTRSLGGSQPVLSCPPVGPEPPAETRPNADVSPESTQGHDGSHYFWNECIVFYIWMSCLNTYIYSIL